MSDKLKVGILGATGMVGQRFISLLENHTKDYGSLEMTDEDSIMDEFVPQLLDYINMKSEDSKFFME